MDHNYSDAEAYKLLERLAEKLVEPYTSDNDKKTLGELRSEIKSLHVEIVDFVHNRRVFEDVG